MSENCTNLNKQNSAWPLRMAHDLTKRLEYMQRGASIIGTQDDTLARVYKKSLQRYECRLGAYNTLFDNQDDALAFLYCGLF